MANENAAHDANRRKVMLAVDDTTGETVMIPVDANGNLLIAATIADLTVSGGGTGVTSFTAYAPIFGGTTATGALQSGTVGSAGQVLTSNGAGQLPTFQAAAASGANTALSNLASVALNTALLPDAAAADDFGSATLPFKDLWFAGSSGTPGTNNFKITGASTSGTRTITFPDASGTVATLAGSEALTNKTLNGLTVTSSTGTLTITNAKTLSVSNTLTFTGTDASSVAFGTGGTVVYTGVTALTALATVSTALTGVLRADSGVLSADTDVTDLVSAASTTAAGKIEIAIASEVTTGTDATRAVSPDALAGSDYGIRLVEVQVVEGATNTAVGDGAGNYRFFVPSQLNGYNLVVAHAAVVTAGTTNTTDIQIANVTQAADMLSTKITIDSGEKTSYTAATPPVIDAANDDVATGDEIRIDVDAISTTPAKGLSIILGFQLP